MKKRSNRKHILREKAVGASLWMQPVKVALEQKGRNKSNPSVKSALSAHKVRGMAANLGGTTETHGFRPILQDENRFLLSECGKITVYHSRIKERVN